MPKLCIQYTIKAVLGFAGPDKDGTLSVNRTSMQVISVPEWGSNPPSRT